MMIIYTQCCMCFGIIELGFYRCRELPVARQVSLLETLAAAASQMAPADKARPGAGPPPLLFLQRSLPPADHLKPQHLNLFLAKKPAESAIGQPCSQSIIKRSL